MNLPAPGISLVCLDIPEVAPSTNRLMRMHWAARNRLIKKWQWLVWLEVFRLGFPSLPPGKLAVRITRYSRHVLDADNLAGTAKVVLDAMKAAALIADDSPAHIDLTCEQESGAPRTMIRLTSSRREPG